ncbi:MAG: TetR/AcrR family transcriptional regulator [Bacteroides sp.]|nr:TetR/AcrR family transcriptional regulator [Bacillota bacterium]MCM1393956.1 TetR/AcrR family transcriptional regulator [[Eubacterium] siraeum]MCM1455135.1 TetR/AcrR family transcriptional regulator [Bacteroides sp.]
MGQEVRTPQQERSIEKKHKIVQAGYELFSDVGYHSTNTAQIAKRAGVSTGIVYGYFKDKHDILLDVLEIHLSRSFSPILKLIDGLCAPINYYNLSKEILDIAISLHKNNAKIHEALHSLSHSDEAVNARFIELEDSITLQISDKLATLGVDVPNLSERIHFAMDIVQSFSHEYIFDNHSYIDYDAMRTIVENTLVALFI